MDNGGGIFAENLSVGYGRSPVIKEVNFELHTPFFAILMGPNGAGKTTLLRALIGLLKPISGRISIYGHDPVNERSKLKELVAYAPQIVNMREEVPIRVYEVVAMGLLSKYPPPRLIPKKVMDEVLKALELVGLREHYNKFFNQLSGGQQRRVLIARALIQKPRVFLLDEPCSMVDFKVRCEIIKLLEKVHREYGTDILITSHDLPACLELEPTIMLINNTLHAYGPPSEVLKPEILRKVYPGLTELEGTLILGEDHVCR